MLVICNGNAKAGRHALTKTVELLGVPWDQHDVGKPGRCVSGHWPTRNPPPEGKHIHVIRHPRNMLVSWVRFTKAEFAPGYLIGSFKSFSMGRPIYEEFAGYVGWLTEPGVLTVSFEDLIADKADTVIAEFLGVPVAPGIPERRPGGTVTWSGELSDWTEYWSDEIEAAWQTARGPEIERMFGYG